MDILLEWLFSKFQPSRGTTWLSRKFARWKYSQIQDKIFDHISNPESKLFYDFYPVSGAGELEFGKSCRGSTGQSIGFHIGVSWGRHGFAGGVLDRNDAKILAEKILLEISTVTPEEDAEARQKIVDRDKELAEYFND